MFAPSTAYAKPNSTDSIQTTNISSLADTRTHSRRHPHQVWNGIPDRSWLCHAPMRPRQLCNSCNMRRQHCRLKPNFLNMLTIPQCSLGWPRETSWQYFVADFGWSAARRQLGDYRPGAVRHYHRHSVRHSIVQDGQAGFVAVRLANPRVMVGVSEC